MMGGSAVAAAVIQVVGVVGAALASIYLWRHRVAVEKDLERREERRRREERVRDLLVAIRAEIAIETATLAQQFDPLVAAQVQAAFAVLVRDDRLRAKTAATLFIFEDIKSELGILPIGCVDEIVGFYKYNARLDGLLIAFASGDYAGIDPERQVKAVVALMQLGRNTLRSGLAAKRAINAFLHERHGLGPRWSRPDDAVCCA
ncbi:hypothetical protein [uncultured Methylobacterium sp.]|uniref:hypothetical protein n=1 Tax=uncultured Methylobacterium sp. TaxID=157278 RepID=UPI0035CB92F7